MSVCALLALRFRGSGLDCLGLGIKALDFLEDEVGAHQMSGVWASYTEHVGPY